MAKTDSKLSRVSDDPQVIEALAKENELATDERALERTLDDISAGIAQASKQKSIDEAAAELLSDGSASLVGVTALYEQRDAVQAKMRVVRRAREINRKALDTATANASRRIAETRKPEYVASLRKLKAAIDALLAAAADEEAFRERAAQDGVSIPAAYQPMRLDTDGLKAWLAEAREFYGL